MYLQNKQEKDGGAPIASPMLKLDLKSREREIDPYFQSSKSYFLQCHRPFLYGGGPLSALHGK